MRVDQARKYLNQEVQLIYFSADGSFTKRKIKVLGITGNNVFGYCYLRKQKRTFSLDHILALHPVYNQKAG